MLPRFQSLAFPLVFGSDSKSTNFKLFSLVTAEVFAQTKANYEKKIPKTEQTKPKPNKNPKQRGKFSYISGISQERCSF